MSTTGFTLEKQRHGPHDSDRLGFWWFDENKTHQCVEFAVIDNHPIIIAYALKRMAARIEEKYYEKKPSGKTRKGVVNRPAASSAQ